MILISWLHRSRVVVALLILGMMIGFSIPPLYNSFDEHDNMDYNLWQDTGATTLAGGEIYPTDGSKFPFMYPPVCATMLAPLSPLPEFFFVLALGLVNSVAWAACIILSVQLATGDWRKAHPAVFLWPSVAVIPLVHNTYLLGQPAVVMLALVLGSFALLRRGNRFSAGALLAVAVAIKAYPVIVAGYFVYRRQWRALLGLVCGILLLFSVVPMAFRTPAEVKSDFSLWVHGMVLKSDEKGIAQRPARSWSYKNQSMQAVVHRLTRPVLARGETDKTWRVNLLDFTYDQSRMVYAAGVLVLLLVYVGASFGEGRMLPVPTVEALEMGMAVVLGIVLAPLAFQYSYVWLMFPVTTLLYLAMRQEASQEVRKKAAWSLAVCVFLLLLSVPPITRVSAAYGNIFFAALAVYVGSAWVLRAKLH